MSDRTADVSISQRDDPILLALREATIGDCEILAELGRGGMAAVYPVHGLTLDRRVTIKVLPPSLLSSEGAAEHVKRSGCCAAWARLLACFCCHPPFWVAQSPLPEPQPARPRTHQPDPMSPFRAILRLTPTSGHDSCRRAASVPEYQPGGGMTRPAKPLKEKLS